MQLKRWKWGTEVGDAKSWGESKNEPLKCIYQKNIRLKVVSLYHTITLIYSVIKYEYEHFGCVSFLVTAAQLSHSAVVQPFGRTVVVVWEKMELSEQVKAS